MAKHATLEDSIYFSLVNCSKRSEDVAGEIGMKHNTLLRKASSTDDVMGFYVDEIVPFMKATGDFDPLDKLNELANRLYVPMPRGVRKGSNPKQEINDYTQKFMKLVQKLIRHVDEPSDELLSEIENLMDRHIGESVNMKRRAKKHLLTQTELEL